MINNTDTRRNYFSSKEYTLDPSKLDPVLDFNNRFIDFNPQHSDLEDSATKLSIEQQGQLKPIYLLKGKVVDGKHRVKILTGLGRSVQAIDLREDLDTEVYLNLCNIETIAGRNLTVTQRAIQAYNYSIRTNTSATFTSAKFQVGRKLLSYVKVLHKLDRSDIVDTLFLGKSVTLPNMTGSSKSLEFLCKKAKELYEANSIVIDNSERIHFNPDAYIKTEQGKAAYYNLINTSTDQSVDIRIALAEWANFKFVMPS